MIPARKPVADRLKYRENWKNLDHDEEEKIWSALTAQVDTTYYRKNCTP